MMPGGLPSNAPARNFRVAHCFDPVAPSQELLFAPIGRRPGHVVHFVHGQIADGARHLVFPVHHGEQHDHAVVFKTPNGTAFERHLCFAHFVLPPED